MNTYENNVIYVENEIKLKELFMILWEKKIMIISIAIIMGILAGVFSIFFLSPVYQSKLNLVINMPEIYNTSYGEYKLPITTNEQYINFILSNDVIIDTIDDIGYDTNKVTIESLKNGISISKVAPASDAKHNNFEVTVSSNNAETSLKLAQTLYNNYKNFMNVMINERAVSYFYDYFSVELKSNEIELITLRDTLKKNEEILSKTPQTIDQKAAMNEISNINNYIVLENIINPNYTEVEKDIIENKQQINIVENNIRVNKESIQELESEKGAIENYYKTGRKTIFESRLTGVVETSIYLPSPPVAPSAKSSPNNSKNIILGLVLGGIIGVLIAFIREYWFKEKKG